MQRITLARLKGSRMIASLIGLAGCSAALMLAARLVRQILQIAAAGGPQQLAVVWPKLVLIGLLAGFAAMAGFAVLVYGTGGLTPWHETAGTRADSIRRYGSSAPVPEAMDPLQRHEAIRRHRSRDEAERQPAEEAIESAAALAAGSVPADDIHAAGQNSTTGSDPVPEGHIRCPACGAVNSEMIPFCAVCGEDAAVSEDA